MKNKKLIIFLGACCSALLCTVAQERNIHIRRLFNCYNEVMNPETKQSTFFGYPEIFLQEFCVNYAMNSNYETTNYEDCRGFQVIHTTKASDGADKIKEIFHEEMDDADIDDKDYEEVGEEESKNEGESYYIYFLFI